MPQQIDVPGVGRLQFPDGMSDADMAAAIQQNFPTVAKAAPARAAAKVATKPATPGSLKSAFASTLADPRDWSINTPVSQARAKANSGEALTGLDKVRAAVAYGMGSSINGLRQLVGMDAPEQAANARFMQQQRAGNGLGLRAAELAGNVLDPVALALPVARAKTLVGMAGYGAAGGAVAGAANYVEPGQSRATNAAVGAVSGGLLTPVIAKAVNRKLPLRRPANSDLALQAGVVPAPKPDALPAIPEPKPDAPQTRVADSVPVPLKPEALASRRGGGQLSANPFADPAAIKENMQAMAKMYQDYIGAPALRIAQQNPGAALGGAFGAATGYTSADEDAPVREKLGRAVAGALLGVGAVKGLGKIPTQAGDLSETTSRLFIDNHGMPEAYVKAKRGRGMFQNQAASQFAGLVEEAGKLDAGQRRLLYNILQGDAPRADDLAGLTDKARETITQFGQKMVDYGLLDPETFQKNAATYIHRSYSSKMKPGGIGDFASRKIKLIGDELRPRGVMREVPAGEVAKWTDLGWETFGQPTKSGKQTIRWQLTKAQREALGEIDDAAYAIAKTGQLMTNDLAVYKFFDDVAQNPSLASVEPKPGWVQVSADKLPKTKVAKFGNLAGKYVPEAVHRDLLGMDYARTLKNAPVVKQYLKLNSWWKLSKTALNPVVHTNNVMSNFVLYDLADARFRDLPKAVKEMRRQGPIFQQARDLGVFDADFASQELRNTSNKILDAYREAGTASTDPLRAAIEITKKAWRNTGGRMTDAYQAEDQVFRLGVFMDRLQKGMSPEDAADDARRWFIDYDISAPGVNVLRATALPFFSYTYRATPLLAEAATLRPWKFAKWAMIGAAINAAGEKWGGGDTRRERALMNEQNKGTIYGLPFTPPQMLKLPMQAKVGGQTIAERMGTGDTSQYLDVTRWVPGGDVLDNSSSRISSVPYLPAPVQPSFGAAGSVINAAQGFDPFTSKTLPGLGLGAASDAKVKAAFLAKQFTPNFPGMPGAYSTQKLADAAAGKPTPLGDTLPVWQAAMQTLGLKIRPADLEKLQMRAGFDTQQQVRLLMERVRMAGKDLQKGRISREAFDKIRQESQAEAMQRLEDLQEKLR